MTEIEDVVEIAQDSYEDLRAMLMKQHLGPEELRDALEDLGAVMEPVRVLERLRGFEATWPGVSRVHPVYSVRHRPCGTVVTKTERVPSLYELAQMAEGHSCGPEESGEPSAVEQARTAMERAYRDVVGMNVFDTKTSALVRAVQGYLHAVVKAERDRVAAEYENSGADSHDDWDALDRVVKLLDPEKGAV